MVAIGTESGGTQDLRTYFRIFWRWKFLFLAVVVVIPVGVYLIERGKPKTYQSSTLIELQDVTVSLGTTSAPVQTGNLDAVARLVTTTPVAKVAAGLVHPHQDPGFMVKAVSASANSDTGFITISAQAGSPQLAANIANAFAGALGVHQAAEAAATIRKQIQGLQGQLKVTSNGQARGSILAQISQLRGLLETVNSGSQVIQPAEPDLTPVGPHVRRTVELSLVIAILIAIGAVLLAESSDRRLRNADDLEKLTGWPLLAVIPRGAFEPEHPASAGEQEAFQMLRAAMTYFNAEERPASVAVISPLIEDGKTTVAVGLALASARAGIRTILVDADLRRPQVGPRLGMTSPTDGLAEVLAGDAQLDNTLVDELVDVPNAGSLSVLPSGKPPANPAALLNSRRMTDVLRRLEERSELVVVDTAAALAVSDALPVIQSAASVVMVVRMNRSSRAAVRRMKKVISSTDARVLGVVATGSGIAAAGYGDYYGKRGRSLFGRRSSGYHTYTSGRNGGRNGAGDEQPQRVTDA